MTTFAEYQAQQTPKTLSEQSELDLRRAIRDHIANLRRAGMDSMMIAERIYDIAADTTREHNREPNHTPGITT